MRLLISNLREAAATLPSEPPAKPEEELFKSSDSPSYIQPQLNQDARFEEIRQKVQQAVGLLCEEYSKPGCGAIPFSTVVQTILTTCKGLSPQTPLRFEQDVVQFIKGLWSAIPTDVTLAIVPWKSEELLSLIRCVQPFLDGCPKSEDNSQNAYVEVLKQTLRDRLPVYTQLIEEEPATATAHTQEDDVLDQVAGRLIHRIITTLLSSKAEIPAKALKKGLQACDGEKERFISSLMALIVGDILERDGETNALVRQCLSILVEKAHATITHESTPSLFSLIFRLGSILQTPTLVEKRMLADALALLKGCNCATEDRSPKALFLAHTTRVRTFRIKTMKPLLKSAETSSLNFSSVASLDAGTICAPLLANLQKFAQDHLARTPQAPLTVEHLLHEVLNGIENNKPIQDLLNMGLAGVSAKLGRSLNKFQPLETTAQVEQEIRNVERRCDIMRSDLVRPTSGFAQRLHDAELRVAEFEKTSLQEMVSQLRSSSASSSTQAV